MNSRFLFDIVALIFILILFSGCTTKQPGIGINPSNVFIGNELRMDVNGNGYTIRDVVIGTGSSIDTDLPNYVKTNHTGGVKISNVEGDSLVVEGNPSEFVGVSFVNNGEFKGRIGASDHSDMDFYHLNFGSINEGANDYGEFWVGINLDYSDPFWVSRFGPAAPLPYVSKLAANLESRLNPVDLADWQYITNSDKTITITKYTNPSAVSCQVPSLVNGFPVTRIGSYAFDDTILVENISIQNEITNIEAAAFADCSALESVSIGDGIREIGENNFTYCSALNSIYYLGNAPSIGSGSFDHSTSVVNYYVNGRTGWPSVPNVFGGQPTAYWAPVTYGTVILPTTSAGLPSGALWNNAGTPAIVP